MNNLKVAILLFFIVTLCTTSVFFGYIRFQYGGVEEYDVFVTVSNFTGINVDTDALYFGTVKPGTMVTRFLKLGGGDEPYETRVIVNGDVASWLFLPESEFVLENNEEKDVKIMLSVPKNVPFGDYSGKIFVISKRI